MIFRTFLKFRQGCFAEGHIKSFALFQSGTRGAHIKKTYLVRSSRRAAVITSRVAVRWVSRLQSTRQTAACLHSSAARTGRYVTSYKKTASPCGKRFFLSISERVLMPDNHDRSPKRTTGIYNHSILPLSQARHIEDDLVHRRGDRLRSNVLTKNIQNLYPYSFRS